MDTLTAAKRSELMSRIRSTGTTPELRAEAAARRLRRRPATHDRSLPGRPDMAFPRSKAAVFVHGCFWHQHAGCAKARRPKTNRTFWEAKFAANRARDRRAARELRAMGWRVLTVWECETRDAVALQERLGRFLRND
jgi:DNA mismatch endonuclease (patch repair protein)